MDITVTLYKQKFFKKENGKTFLWLAITEVCFTSTQKHE